MSERAINDPSQHGWVEVNGKWIWGASGGGTGAGMVISEAEPTDKVEGMQWLNPTNGLVLFWDDEKWLQMPGGKNGADGADGVDGLWTDSGDGHANYSGGKFSQLRITRSGAASDNSVSGVVFNNDATTNGVGITGCYQQGFKFFTTTDSTSGQPLDSSVRKEILSITANGVLSLPTVENADYALRLQQKNNDSAGGLFIDAATRSTSLNGATRLISVIGGGSLGEVFGVAVNGTVNGTRMLSGGHVVATAKDIIETLSTLRNATKDETTLEGLRDAIGNAVGGLIEKFEAMQAEAEDE